MPCAQENPIATIYTGKIHEVQKHITATGHAYGAHVMVASRRMWETLSDASGCRDEEGGLNIEAFHCSSVCDGLR